MEDTNNPAARGSVLVIDVDTSRLQDIASLLATHGFAVNSAASPEEGLEELGKQSSDLVLLGLKDPMLAERAVSTVSDHSQPIDNRDLSLESAERRHIEYVLALFGNHRTRAARALGISRTTLYKKMDDAVVQNADGNS